MSDSGSLDIKQEPHQKNTRILRDNDVIASAISAQGSHAESSHKSCDNPQQISRTSHCLSAGSGVLPVVGKPMKILK